MTSIGPARTALFSRRKIFIALLLMTALWCRAFRGSSARVLKSDDFELIQIGMDLSQVQDILGGPPGDYGRQWGRRVMTLEGAPRPPGSVERVWLNDVCRLEVSFDTSHKVVSTHRRIEFHRLPTTVLDVLLYPLEKLVLQFRRLIGR